MSTQIAPLNAAASLYSIQESDLQPLRGGHFAGVYGFKRGGREYVLRLTPPNDNVDVKAQRSILVWMAYLATHGASVPTPLRSQKGNLVEVISAPEGEWLTVAYTRAEGILSEELSLDQWGEDLFQVLGKSIGKTHAIACSYVPSKEVSYPDWKTGGNLFNRQIENELWLQEKQSQLLTCIHDLPRPDDAYGLVHCDLHFGNFFVDVPKQIVTMIDFDDCAFGWFVMDIAVLLFDVLVLYPNVDKDAYALHFLSNFLTGYLAEKPLSLAWLEQLPIFLKLIEINVYDMVAKYYPDDADEWILKFMPGRQERLKRNVPYVELNYSASAGLYDRTFPHSFL